MYWCRLPRHGDNEIQGISCRCCDSGIRWLWASVWSIHHVDDLYRERRQSCLQGWVKYGNAEFIQVHPTAVPGADKLRLMSESARGEGGRVWVPRKPQDARDPKDIPVDERYYFLKNDIRSTGISFLVTSQPVKSLIFVLPTACRLKKTVFASTSTSRISLVRHSIENLVGFLRFMKSFRVSIRVTPQ